jgi:hypothetical protein
MSEFKEKASIQYAFDKACEEVNYELNWMQKFTKGKEWLSTLWMLAIWLFVLFIVRGYIVDVLEEQNIKAALTYVLCFVIMGLASVQYNQHRKTKQLAAMMDMIKQLKADKP